MHGAIAPPPPLSAEFQTSVAQALKLCRDGNILELATLPLAHSPLVENCLLTEATNHFDERGRALMSVLRWGVERLKPAGQPGWGLPTWQPYLILHSYYLSCDKTQNPYVRDDPEKNPLYNKTSKRLGDKRLRITFGDLAEWMDIEEATVFARRQIAIEMLTTILKLELQAPRFAEERRLYALTDRYYQHPEAAQRLLRIVSVFRHPVPLDWVYALASPNPLLTLQNALTDLFATQWLLAQPEQPEVFLHPRVRPIIQRLLTPTERVNWQQSASRFYLAMGDYLEAAYHLKAAGQSAEAAQLLLDRRDDITRTLQIEDLLAILLDFRQAELSEAHWTLVRLVAGQMSELVKDFDTALTLYQDALNAADPMVRAEAYYRRAKVLEGKNIAEALVHYNISIQILMAYAPYSALLTEIYIQRAWIFIQGQTDLARAANDLQEAQRLVNPGNLKHLADLHNAWAEVNVRRGDYAIAIEHRLQARVAAATLQNIDLMMKLAHNLGLDYAHLRQYDMSLMYLKESEAIARKVGNVNFEGAVAKSMGACYFWQERYTEAIRAYEQAYQHFENCGNRAWQGRVCFDLAEVWQIVQQPARAQRYAQEGLSIAAETNDTEMRLALQALLNSLNFTAPPNANRCLNERQRQALDYLHQHGHISNRDYQGLTGASARQALRDLSDLVSQGLVLKSGAGSGTRYGLPKPSDSPTLTP